MQSTQPNSPAHEAPLLRSIAREIVERTGAIALLSSRLEEAVAADGPTGDEAARLTALLAVQRRELRLAEKELARLGWRRDPERLIGFVRPSGAGDANETWELERSGFHRAVTDALE